MHKIYLKRVLVKTISRIVACSCHAFFSKKPAVQIKHNHYIIEEENEMVTRL